MRAAEAGLNPIERWVIRLAGPSGGVLLLGPAVHARRVRRSLDRMLGQFGRGGGPGARGRPLRNILEVFEARQPEELTAATVS